MLIAQAKRSYASQTPPKTFPKPGTADYETIKGQAVTLLVQQAEREEKATSMGITISDTDVAEAPRPDQEAVLRRQRDEVPGAAEEAGPDRRAGARGHPPAADLGGALRQGDEGHQGLRQARCTPTTSRTSRVYSTAQSRDVRHILVKSQAARQTALHAAEGGQRQDLVHAREEVLAGSELEERLRQADGLEGTDGARVRQGRLQRARRRSFTRRCTTPSTAGS